MNSTQLVDACRKRLASDQDQLANLIHDARNMQKEIAPRKCELAQALARSAVRYAKKGQYSDAVREMQEAIDLYSMHWKFVNIPQEQAQGYLCRCTIYLQSFCFALPSNLEEKISICQKILALYEQIKTHSTADQQQISYYSIRFQECFFNFYLEKAQQKNLSSDMKLVYLTRAEGHLQNLLKLNPGIGSNTQFKQYQCNFSHVLKNASEKISPKKNLEQPCSETSRLNAGWLPNAFCRGG